MLVLGMPTSVSNFYPRSPCGERRSRSGLVLRQSHFYPRSPCGERHLLCMPLWWLSHFYPRSPCGERLCTPRSAGPLQAISIHALLAESDDAAGWCRGGRPRFLSTLSLRRATRQRRKAAKPAKFLSTLSLRRATYSSPASFTPPLFLSTLSLRRATKSLLNSAGGHVFLSTLSLRRATQLHPNTLVRQSISIHALLAESDSNIADAVQDVQNFYPRSPCGERPA